MLAAFGREPSPHVQIGGDIRAVLVSLVDVDDDVDDDDDDGVARSVLLVGAQGRNTVAPVRSPRA